MNSKLLNLVNWAGLSLYEDASRSKLERKGNKVKFKGKWLTMDTKLSDHFALLATKIHNTVKKD